MEHTEFVNFDSMCLSAEHKLMLRDDYIKYLEYKVNKLKNREKILIEIISNCQNGINKRT